MQEATDANEKPNLLPIMHKLGPRPISDKRAQELAEQGAQNAAEYDTLDTLVQLAELFTLLDTKQRRELVQKAGMDMGTYNEMLFRAEYLARSAERGRTTLERHTSEHDQFTLAGEKKATINAYDQGDHRRGIVLRIEDDGSGPTVKAFAQLVDVRGFVITAEKPTATLDLRYDQVTSHETLNTLLLEALDESAAAND